MMDQDNIENVVTSHGSDENSQINISDVIEVIQTTDPQAQAMFNNVADVTMQASQIHPQPQSNANTSNAANSSNSINSYRRSAFVKITEQPASKALRFRYECEGRSAGSIPGVLSSPENKTFPSIQVVGYRGRAVVVVSCVTKDPPYRPHPHNLVGKEGCKKGVCTVEINSDTMSVTFSNLGIQCVKKRDIDEALRVREEIRVDPYRTGFNHRSQPSSIDLNAVRLCFQVFLESEQRGRFTVPLSPVVSDPIFDKKAMSDLVICKLSDASCTVAGGKEMILLCEKVAKEDISVRFFEEIDDNIVWEGYGDFQHTNVHKQVAIWFRTPRYKSIDIDQPVRCYVQLKRPSDGVTSEPLPFDYLPLDSDTVELKRKRLKIGNESNLFNHMRTQSQQHQDGQLGLGLPNITDPKIKKEPMENSLSPYHRYANTISPSPQPLSPATPAILNQTSYNITPNITQFVTHSVIPQFIQSNQTTSQQFNPNSFNIPPIIPPMKSSPTVNNDEPTSSTYEPNAALSLLLDMDNQQFTHINSGELSTLSLSFLDGHYASNATTEPPRADNTNQMDQDNMTDSFTRFATEAIRELNDLGTFSNNSNKF